MAYGEEDIKIRIDADTKDALRSLKNLEKQVDKLGDLADQGEREQKGFLSPKQVALYRKILAEMEKDFNQHQQRLDAIKRKYDERHNREEYQKLKKLEEELRKREEAYKDASNRGVNPNVEEFHRTKLEDARAELETYRGSDEYQKYENDTSELESGIDDLTRAIELLQGEMNRTTQHTQRIDNLRVRDPVLANQLNGITSTLSSLAGLTGIGGYIQYSSTGIDMLRYQQRQGYEVSQRLDEYNGVENSDATQREKAQIIGEKNNYGVQDTLNIQGILQRGGTNNSEALGRDTEAVQAFSRNYAISAEDMAHSTNILKKIGATSEGEMEKFARMLAGEIEKSGANGREEEMLRANISLVHSVSQGMAKLTDKQLGGLMGLQTQLAQNSPTLMGERGARVLSDMDSGFKNGGHELEILMGKGTKYNTITEMAELRQNLAYGVARPENITELLGGITRQFGDINTSPQADAIAQEIFSTHMGIDPLMYKELKDSGTLKEWSEGRMPNAQDFLNVGDEETAKKLDKYLGTDTSEIQNVEAQAENFQADHAKGYEDIATGFRGFMHGLPDPLQHALLPLLAGGAGTFIGMGGSKLLKHLSPMIKDYKGGSGGLLSGLKNMKLPNFLESMKGGAGNLFSKIGGMGGGASGSATTSLGKNVLSASGKLLGKAPVVGALAGAGIDQMVNPEHNWGRSIAKGVGGAIGGTLGFLGGGLLGLGTGGVGLLGIGATTIGGGMAGEALADKAYSLVAGEDDLKSNSTVVNESTGTPEDYTSASQSIEISELTAQTIKINDKSLEEIMTNMAKANQESSSKPNTVSEQIIRVILEGDIKNMSSDNQDKVTDALVDLFSAGGTSSYKGYSGWRNNLSVDEYRR